MLLDVLNGIKWQMVEVPYVGNGRQGGHFETVSWEKLRQVGFFICWITWHQLIFFRSAIAKKKKK